MTRRRAVTPVIATVILIAVAVALGIAVAFWAGALTSGFSKYGKLQLLVSTHYATSNGGSWTVTMGGSNKGSQDLSITQIQINGQPFANYLATLNESLPIPVPSGGSFAFVLTIPQTGFSSGQNVQVTIITNQPEDYPVSITLP